METKLGLTELVLRSEKRKNVLIFLRNGPKSIDEILEHLAVDSVSILPQIKKLKDGKLVLQKNHTYELSIIGKIIADRMLPLMDTLEVFEYNFDYWSRRRLEGVPKELKGRIGELKNCKLIRPDVSHMFELNPEFVEKLLLSRKVCSFTSYFHPSIIPLYLELANKGAEICLILTPPLLQRLKKDYRESLQTLMGFENVRIFLLSKEPKLAGITVTDILLMLTVFPEAKHFEYESLLSIEPEALKWGIDFFSCLQKETVQLEEI